MGYPLLFTVFLQIAVVFTGHSVVYRTCLEAEAERSMPLYMLERMDQCQRIFAATQPDKNTITLSDKTKLRIGSASDPEDLLAQSNWLDSTAQSLRPYPG